MKTGSLFALACLVSLPLQALAHLGLAVTVPEHDAVLERAPTLVHFQFMATMRLTNVLLQVSDGERRGEHIELRLPRDDEGRPSLFGDSFDLPLPALEPGSYELVWQAEALNGQLLVDDLTFTITSE